MQMTSWRESMLQETRREVEQQMALETTQWKERGLWHLGPWLLRHWPKSTSAILAQIVRPAKGWIYIHHHLGPCESPWRIPTRLYELSGFGDLLVPQPHLECSWFLLVPLCVCDRGTALWWGWATSLFLGWCGWCCFRWVLLEDFFLREILSPAWLILIRRDSHVQSCPLMEWLCAGAI